MNTKRAQHVDEALEQGLQLLMPLLRLAEGDQQQTMSAMNQANEVQKHYRKALERCPVCEDSACETKSAECGK
jgi:hypothetical protein